MPTPYGTFIVPAGDPRLDSTDGSSSAYKNPDGSYTLITGPSALVGGGNGQTGLSPLSATATPTTAAPPAAPQVQTPPTTPAAPASTPPGASGAATQLNPAQTAKAIKDILSGPVLDNPLNNVRQPTYHYRLFLTQDIDPANVEGVSNSGSLPEGTTTKVSGGPSKVADLYAAIDAMPQVTLAESGVTGYNIKSVELGSYITGNAYSRMLNLSDITIVITEPMGTGFAESIVAAANKLQVSNYRKSWFYLELTFIAYNEDGSINTNPCLPLGTGTDSKWLWQIAIGNIDTHIDAGGGTYTIHAFPFQEENGYHDEIYTIPVTLTIKGKTLGEFTDSLATEMTTSWKKRYGNDVIKYKIVWHDFDPASTLPANYPKNARDFAMKDAQPGLSQQSHLEMGVVDGIPTAKLQTGVTIDKMIEAILVHNEQAQKLCKDTPVTGSTTPTDPTKPVICIVFRMEVDVEVGDFEIISQQYYRTITYHVWPYFSQSGFVNVNQQANSLQPVTSWLAMQDLIKKGLCKKHYDYLYTGLNTEVLEFDIKYSYAWNAILPKALGLDATSEDRAPQNRIKPDAPGAQQVVAVQQMVKSIQADQAKAATLIRNSASASQLLAQLNDPTTSPEDRANLQKQLMDTYNVSTQAGADALKTEGEALNLSLSARVNALTAANAALHKQAQVQSAANNGKASTYAETLLQNPNAPLTSGTGIGDPRILPITFEQGNKDVVDQIKTGVHTQPHADKTIFAAVLGQLYAPVGLQQVHLTIRGDPFWLATTNLGRLVALRGSGSQALLSPDANVPEYYRGETCIVIKWRTPLRIGDDFSPQFNDDLVFNGIYKVAKIQHFFVDGGFKQTLECLRVPLIDIFKAANYEPSDADLNSNSAAVANAAGTTSPPQITASPTGVPGGSGSPANGNKAAFIAQNTAYALQASAATGISPEIILAQSALETGYGKSVPGGNYFGIKATAGQPSTSQTTQEFVDGQAQTQQANFVAYDGAAASFNGYANFMNGSSRWAPVLAAGQTGDLAAQANALQAAKYATDPQYASKVLSIAQSIHISR